MLQYIADWKAKGYDAEPVLRGDRYTAASGAILDGRQYWISLVRTDTEAQAKQIVKKLEALQTWAWLRVETLQPGSGTVSIRSNGQPIGTFALPLK